MSDFRRVTDDVSVAPQISVADVAEAAKQGFKTIINNRPDGEEPGQPLGLEIQAAAEAAGLTYIAIPIKGGPTPEQVQATGAAVNEAETPILAFCRSGTRSIVCWSISQAAAGAFTRSELIDLGRAAGYDLTGPLGG